MRLWVASRGALMIELYGIIIKTLKLTNLEAFKMKKLTPLYILCVLFLCVSCASTNSNVWEKVSVDYVYDPEVDFTELKSYEWFPIPSKSIRYPLIIEQIKFEMNRQLKVNNINMVIHKPDFLIALHGGIQSVLPYEDWQYLHRNYEEYALKRRIDMTTYTDDTLMVDFISAKSGTLIYRATANVYTGFEPSPEKRRKLIMEAVTKVIDTFLQIPYAVSTNEQT
jgi:hypothetical protein